MSFAKNLSTRREKLDLSSEELANRIHVSRSYVTLLEGGKRFPGKTLLSRIARALRLKRQVVVRWYLADQKEKLG